MHGSDLLWSLQQIYKRGARKFVFMNLPPLGCLPGTRIIDSEGNGSCLQELSSLASLHNQALSVVLLQLEKQLKGFKFSLYDFNADLTQMINFPFKYGKSLVLALKPIIVYQMVRY